jgi:hypothetical protein
MEFNQIWILLAPQGEYKRREKSCARLWQGYSAEMQEAIFNVITASKLNGGEIHPNPYFAIEDTALALQRRAPKRQVLTFKEYYERFGTTEPQDGWHMENPTGEQVVYVKD